MGAGAAARHALPRRDRANSLRRSEELDQRKKGGAREPCEEQTIGAAEETITDETPQRILSVASDARPPIRSPSSARRDARTTSPSTTLVAGTAQVDGRWAAT